MKSQLLKKSEIQILIQEFILSENIEEQKMSQRWTAGRPCTDRSRQDSHTFWSMNIYDFSEVCLK